MSLGRLIQNCLVHKLRVGLPLAGIMLLPNPATAQHVEGSQAVKAGHSARSLDLVINSAVVHVDVMANRHPISPYIYGANFPPSQAYIANAGITLNRWGGNSSSRYNWKLNVTNLASDNYFENFAWNGTGLATNSASFLSSVVTAGGSPLMTIPMLPWVAKDASSSSFSEKKYGKQCASDAYRTDAGDGLLTNCSTELTGNDPTDAHVPMLDQPSAGDPSGSVYRDQWVESLSTQFSTHPHFYALDNEPDIWSQTHRDVHPAPTGYDELAAEIVKEGHSIKAYDPLAVRFAPVSCCWYYYWNGVNNNDKSEHAGVDFLPWLLNEVRFEDTAAGSKSLDVFDVHAYFNGPSILGMTTTQLRAAALRETRDWWDSTYVSESAAVNQQYTTQMQPDKTVAFVIPRMRALANTIYPGLPVSFTEWNGALAGETDFSTALVDADAYGILGRERMYAAARWVAAVQGSPAYDALLLYRNADGNHDGFQSVSVAASSNANPNLFSVFAATDLANSTLTLIVVNKDPANAARIAFDLAGFNAAKMRTYTLSSANPASIIATAAKSWSSAQSFAPYSVTLIIATAVSPQKPAVEWDLNPDTLTAPASSTVTIAPGITSGSGSFTLVESSSTAGLELQLTQPKLTVGKNGQVTIKTPATPGLYQFTLTGEDSANIIQSKQGWVLVANPAATLTKTGDNQTAPRGNQITLIANFLPGSSGASADNVSILFSTSAGALSSRVVHTDGSGKATVTLTLPANAGKVTVTAQAPIPLGGEQISFTETAQ